MAEELNEETQVQDSTTVEQVDVNIDEMFGQPGAESIMLPAEEVEPEPEQKKSNLFSKGEEFDPTFIDKTETTTEVASEESAPEADKQLETVSESMAAYVEALAKRI